MKKASPARWSGLLVPSLLIFLLTANADTACAQTKTVAERLGYPPESKLLIIMGDAGATVTVLNTGTNVSVTVRTNEAGDFTAPNLAVGPYSVKVQHECFTLDR